MKKSETQEPAKEDITEIQDNSRRILVGDEIKEEQKEVEQAVEIVEEKIEELPKTNESVETVKEKVLEDFEEFIQLKNAHEELQNEKSKLEKHIEKLNLELNQEKQSRSKTELIYRLTKNGVKETEMDVVEILIQKQKDKDADKFDEQKFINDLKQTKNYLFMLDAPLFREKEREVIDNKVKTDQEKNDLYNRIINGKFGKK